MLQPNAEKHLHCKERIPTRYTVVPELTLTPSDLLCASRHLTKMDGHRQVVLLLLLVALAVQGTLAGKLNGFLFPNVSLSRLTYVGNSGVFVWCQLIFPVTNTS